MFSTHPITKVKLIYKVVSTSFNEKTCGKNEIIIIIIFIIIIFIIM